MAKIGGLGRGLDALMGESSGESGGFLEKKENSLKELNPIKTELSG